MTVMIAITSIMLILKMITTTTTQSVVDDHGNDNHNHNHNIHNSINETNINTTNDNKNHVYDFFAVRTRSPSGDTALPYTLYPIPCTLYPIPYTLSSEGSQETVVSSACDHSVLGSAVGYPDDDP